MKNNKKIIIPAMLLSVLSIIPMYFIFTYIVDLSATGNKNSLGAKKVDEILSRTINSIDFLIPAIAIITISVIQGVFSAIIISKYKGWENKGFAITNLFFGGVVVSNVFLLIKLFRNNENTSVFKVSRVGVGTITSISIPAGLIALSVASGSIDAPTKLSAIVLSSKVGSENVIQIFTDGLDPEKATPLFQKDPVFKDFIVVNNFVTGGYTTEPSYSELLGGFGRNPYFLKDELNHENGKVPVEGLNHKSYDAYLHDNFMDSVLNNLGRDGFERSYIGNPDDLGYFSSYFRHVSGSPEKLQNRNKVLLEKASKQYSQTKTKPTPSTKLGIWNWGQAKDETSSFGYNKWHNNAAVYKWMSEHTKVSKTLSGARVLIQDSMTHAPRIMGANGEMSFAGVADSAGVGEGKTFKGMHSVLSDFIASIPTEVRDNSMIVIYGDHADHSKTIDKPNDPKNKFTKNRSQLFIKYPHSHTAVTTMPQGGWMTKTDIPLASYHLNWLISQYMKNKGSYDGKTKAEQVASLKAAIRQHTNWNSFFTVKSSDASDGVFTKIDSNNKLVEDKSILTNTAWTNYEKYADEKYADVKSPNYRKLHKLFEKMRWT